MDACSRACVYTRLAEPSKAEQSSLEARSVCERARLCMRSTEGRCNDFLQNQKMVDDCVAGKRHEGWRVGAKKSNFQFPTPLARGSSQQRCGFKPSSTRSGSGPLNKCYRRTFSLHGSYVFAPSMLQCFCYRAFPCLCAGRFRGWSYDDHCAYHRCRMTFSQTTIIWREGIGSEPGHRPGLETASRAHMPKR
jgi:hypothetical protein